MAHIVDGALVAVPRSITSNLLAIGSRAVFDALWTIRDLVDETTPDRNRVTRGYNPPEAGWVIRAADGPTPADPDRPVHKLVDLNLIIPWVRAHLDIGVSSLLEHHHAGSSRATEILRTILTSRFERFRISEADEVVEAAIGTKALKTLKKRPRVKLTAEAILTQLDGCWSGETPTTFASWPYFSTGVSRETDEYHALRMIAVRGSGAQWGLIFQRLAGVPLHPQEPAEVQFFSYGSDCELGQDHGPPYRLVQVEDPSGAGIEGVVVKGRRGQLTLEDQMVESLDLRPGQSVEPHGAHHRANLILRAYNTHFPDAVWRSQDPKYFVSERVGFERGKVLFVAETFAHAGARPDQPGALRPSESPTFRSLAEAIATKKPAVFEPGVSNLDWRLHVTDSPDAGRLG
jgi:hypothetical protein